MKALIIVDIQNDFLPGGSLAVPEGNEVIPVVNGIMGQFDLVVATQDWHPADHGSFASSHPDGKLHEVVQLNGLDQVLWPVHCVQESYGARFSEELKGEGIDKVFQKGTEKQIDSYSGFFDNGRRKATGLGAFLIGAGVTEVYVCGLATDYCVKFTAMDAASLGFRTFVIEDACRGVNVNPGDVDRALVEMEQAGCRIIQSDEIGASAHYNLSNQVK